jgi:hypothetical protein
MGIRGSKEPWGGGDLQDIATMLLRAPNCYIIFEKCISSKSYNVIL